MTLSGRVESLWDMLKVFAPWISNSAYNLGIVAEGFVSQSRVATELGNHSLVCSHDKVKGICAAVAAIEQTSQDLNLKATNAQSKRCGDYISNFKHHDSDNCSILIEKAQNFGHMLHSLSTVFSDELAAIIFVAVRQSDKTYLEDGCQPFGPEVEDAFPSAAFEITEASKCRAFERWTASVMHLMRALETGLACLADFAGVDPKENWNKLLNEMEAKLRQVGKKTHGAEEEQFAAEAITHFRAIKNAWRNHAMHAREKYDEERAVAIYDSVRSFMRHLATRLRE
ncbi:MAG TPA: hypothetical protein VFW19_10300 [Allosphingosinicella sp.]|nr:hypothetical protein [Allosphingosinicella sp.]